MKTRIITAIVGILVLIGVLFTFDTLVFNFVIAAITLIAIHEVFKALGFGRKEWPMYAVFVPYTLLIMLSSYQVWRRLVMPASFLMVLFFGIYLVVRNAQVDFAKASGLVMFSGIVIFCFYSFIRLKELLPVETYGYDAMFFILLILCFAWGGDTCAYFAGRAFGKHKLCPVVSPKKTVEGAIGGVLGTMVFGVIAIHEFGHFMVAKLCGVQVNEFSIGMGPVLCKRVRKGTQYSIRALPVGGYVALEGEESPESKQAEERSNPSAADGGSSPDRGALGIAETSPEEEKPAGIPLNEAPVWQRALIMLAGAGMNFVLGFVVMAILITAQSEPITSKVLYQVEENALCGQTGLQAGDKILAVNGRRCFVANDILYELMRTEDYTADFTVLRDGKKVELPGVQFDTWQDDKGETHMSLGFTVYGIKKTPLNVLKEAGNSVLYYGRIIFASLSDLLRGRESINDLSGPVGIVTAIGQAASYGWQDLLEMLVLITVNVGIFNLLPFPALDGGKVVFLLIEGVTGHAVPEKIQSGLIVAAFALLFGLMIFATYNDILRLITGAM